MDKISDKAEVHFYDGMIMFPPGTYELVIKREREKEREACAKVCEEIRKDSLFVEQHMVGKCIEAIRARNV